MISRIQQIQCILQKIRSIDKQIEKEKNIKEKERLKLFRMDCENTLKMLSE